MRATTFMRNNKLHPQTDAAISAKDATGSLWPRRNTRRRTQVAGGWRAEDVLQSFKRPLVPSSFPQDALGGGAKKEILGKTRTPKYIATRDQSLFICKINCVFV